MQISKPDERLFAKLGRNELLRVIIGLIEHGHLKPADVQQLVAQQREGEVYIPTTIFTQNMSCFQAVCVYLYENLGYRFHDIAGLLGRDDRTIWSTYHSIRKVYKKPLPVGESSILIPVSIFSQRKFSFLENLVAYLRNELGLSYHEVADLLKRDDRTIWTCYSRWGIKSKKKVVS